MLHCLPRLALWPELPEVCLHRVILHHVHPPHAQYNNVHTAGAVQLGAGVTQL